MAESYHLKVLGSPELLRSDGTPVRLKVRKHLALLIYLLLEERSLYYRDELAELLWPGVPEQNSRHSLSMAFSVLRGLFGHACITGNHAAIRFATPDVRLDLAQLDSGDILGSETVPALEVDAFLRDFHIDDAPGFAHWRDRRNAQLLPALQAGLLMLTDQARRSGDLARMLALADRLLYLDPLSEEGIRARMEVFALQGDRIGALRVFEAWKQQLAEELGAEPSELLQELAARLRRRLRSPLPTSVAAGATSEPVFVGRAAEYQALFEAWEATTQLNTRHVLVTGESGIGKSTLALRFGSAAALEGAVVARVQCFELEQRIAYGMIGALVTSLLDEPACSGTAPEALAALARIVPRVKERFPHLPAPVPAQGDAARLQFSEAVTALAGAILDEHALVLIIDDYPRSDEASLSVLHFLLRRMAGSALMVVLCERPPEPGEPPQAARIRQGILALSWQRIELRPLKDAESEEVIDGLLARVRVRPDSPERRAIVRMAGGNPMALELLTRDWMTHGDAALAVLLPAMTEAPAGVLQVVDDDRLISRILPALAPRTRVALYLAAILGPRLNDLDYFTVVGFTPAQTMAALSELVETRVLRNSGKGLEFINELIRARLYLKIPDAARVRLHTAVADRLLEGVARGEAIPGLELAWHCIRAKRREEAVPFLMRGAREAITRGAPDEAARALTSALDELKGRTRAEALLLLAETYQEMGAWSDVLECLGRISSVEKAEPPVAELTFILEMEAQQYVSSSSIDRLTKTFERLLDSVRGGSQSSTRIRASLTAGLLLNTLRDPRLQEAVRSAIGEVQFSDLDSRDLVRLLLARALTAYSCRDRDNGLTELRAAQRLLGESRAGDTNHVQIHIGLGAIACTTGSYSAALPPLKEAYNAASKLDNKHLMCNASLNLALCHHRLGDIEEALRWAKLALANSNGAPQGAYNRIACLSMYAFASLAANESRRARSALQSLRDLWPQLEIPWVKQAFLIYEADICTLLNLRTEAYEAAERMRLIADTSLSLGHHGKYVRWSTILLLETDREKLEDLLVGSYSGLRHLDAADRVEVLCSIGLARNRFLKGLPDTASAARRGLANLPSTCVRQLEQLGLRLPN